MPFASVQHDVLTLRHHKKPMGRGAVKTSPPPAAPPTAAVQPSAENSAQFVQIPGTDTYKKVMPGQATMLVIAQEAPKQDDTINTLITAIATKLTPMPEASPPQPAPLTATQIAEQVQTIADERLTAFNNRNAPPKPTKDSPHP